MTSVNCSDICSPLPPLQSSTGSFSQKLWLGVAATSVSLYRQGEAEALESFPYGQICSYGISDSNTFKITAGDRDLLFETTKVLWVTPQVSTYKLNLSNRFFFSFMYCAGPSYHITKQYSAE